MLEATITVIHKARKDPEDCASYRPISLLNIDAKLFTGILAHRLNPYMPGLIDLDQAGFIPHRQCGDNSKRLLHLIDKTGRSRREVLLLSIDAENAFDRVHWPYLFQVLERFGWGPGFRTWIQCIYCAPKAAVRVNGTLFLPFSVGRGTRQGCPLSPLLFVLYMEPFAQRLRDNPLVDGIKFGGEHHLISLYADDVILTLSEPMVSLPALMVAMEEFGQVQIPCEYAEVTRMQNIGLSISPDHVEAQRARYPFVWSTSQVPYLDIELATSAVKTVSVNYATLTREILRDLGSWGKHNLSWLGRVAAVKMTVLPRILHIFQWSRSLSEKHWCFMDQAVAGSHIWKEPWLRRGHRADGLYSSLITGVTMHVWDAVASRQGLTMFPSPMSPIGENPDFPPGLQVESFRRWYDGGCKRVGSLFDESGAIPFEQMQEMYQLTDCIIKYDIGPLCQPIGLR
ncbi:hypothetical protein NDU88_000213 [Pleurodeles waltl]|uniref:Reverse transcriptase domain-containing protein n=1 Tax=Pleurodeles waltl TaxID=8319 RepID=A0AAV7TEB3_PLEWA|nr:hypothetical protein NDU88_000213 [Pleurodeles waltl]